ncbi:histone acetyltransferases subunit 3-domain-containing protein, partial [Flagelloscypha sp. PMI_526]
AQKPPEMPPLDTQPLRPEDVKEDFSKMKAPPNQTSVHHFYSYIDPYLRPLREEDIGLLEYTADEVEPYIVPKLGKHYLQQWADSDQGIFPTPGTYDLAPPPGPPNPGFDPSQATDRELTREDVGHGPLSERVLSALIPLSDEPGKDIWPSVKTAEDAMTGRPGGSGAAASRKERALLGGKNGLEERLGGTLRYHAILDPSGPNPDFSNAQSDNVAVALRDMQQELRQVIAQNKARKSRLAERAKDLLAKQEYVETRDQIDKSILGLYTRQQKAQGKDAKELSGRDRDKKKKKRIVNDEEEEETKKEKIPASALGLGVDVETNHLLVSDQMMELIRLRRNWIDKVGGILKARERDAEEEAEVDEEATVGVLESEGTGGGVPSSRTSTVMPSDRDQESLQPSDNVLDDSAMDIT